MLVAPSEHPSQPAAAGLLARGYALAVIGLRWLIIGGWAAAVAAAILFPPPLNASSGGLSELVPAGSTAAHAESDAAKLFGFLPDAGSRPPSSPGRRARLAAAARFAAARPVARWRSWP